MTRKIIAILADFPWSFFEGGATGRGGGQACTWLSQLAVEFAEGSPYEIHWITLDRSRFGAGSELREWGGQFFHRIPGLKASIDLRLGYCMSRWQLSRKLLRIRPALVHCWGTETAYPVVCGRSSVPVILSMQGILTEYRRIGGLPNVYYWNELERREPEYLKDAAVVTCESQWGIDRVKEVNPAIRTYQVEYGVNPSFFDLTWKPDTENPYALFSGSIDGRKGVDTLMDAIVSIKNRGWRLKLAGYGPLFEQLSERKVPGVEWLGLLDWKRLQQELVGAMCLVLPTRADTSPNVVKEARVIGLPVITTVHGGQSGYIHNGVNGIIVDPLDSEELAQALSRLMGDLQLSRRMGAARHAEDRAYFQPSRTARGFLEIYDKLLSESSSASHNSSGFVTK